MSQRHDFEQLLSDSLRVPPLPAALQDRIARQVVARLSAGPPQHGPRRRWVWAVAAVVCLIGLVIWRPEAPRLTPSLQWTRMAMAAERAPIAHYREYALQPNGERELQGEAWMQPPSFRSVRKQGEGKAVSGYDGDTYWRYDTWRRSLHITHNSIAPTLDDLTIDAILASLRNGASPRDAIVTEGQSPDGREATIVTSDGLNSERMVFYADPITHLPFMIEVYRITQVGQGGQTTSRSFELLGMIDIDYPEPRALSFFAPDAPADYAREETTLPDPPTADEVRASLDREPVAVVEGWPPNSTVPILDVALCGDLAFVAYEADGRPDGLRLSADHLSGYLFVAAFQPRDRSTKDRRSVLTDGRKVGGVMFCTPDPESKPVLPSTLYGLVFSGGQARQVSAALPPEKVRTVSDIPAWWTGLYPDPGLFPAVDWARATYWLDKDAHKAVAYAEKVLKQAQGRHYDTPAHWQLLGDVRHADGDDAGAVAAYDRGLAQLGSLSTQTRESWRRKLEAAKSQVTGRPASGPTNRGAPHDTKRDLKPVTRPAQGTQGG